MLGPSTRVLVLVRTQDPKLAPSPQSERRGMWCGARGKRGVGAEQVQPQTPWPSSPPPGLCHQRPIGSPVLEEGTGWRCGRGALAPTTAPGCPSRVGVGAEGPAHEGPSPRAAP